MVNFFKIVCSAESHKAVTYKMLSSNCRFFDCTEWKTNEVYHFPDEEIYRTIISSMIAAAITVPHQ